MMITPPVEILPSTEAVNPPSWSQWPRCRPLEPAQSPPGSSRTSCLTARTLKNLKSEVIPEPQISFRRLCCTLCHQILNLKKGFESSQDSQSGFSCARKDVPQCSARVSRLILASLWNSDHTFYSLTILKWFL